jgi:hypothetical protein
MIPEGSLYTENTRLAGEIAEHMPDEYTDSNVAEGEAGFGKMVVKGSAAGQAKIISAASDTPWAWPPGPPRLRPGQREILRRRSPRRGPQGRGYGAG